MSTYQEYIREIEERKGQGLHPKPIDSAALLEEIIAQIKDNGNANRKDSIQFFVYNTLPGTTPAAGVKAQFLKAIILEQELVEEIIVLDSFSTDKTLHHFSKANEPNPRWIDRYSDHPNINNTLTLKMERLQMRLNQV